MPHPRRLAPRSSRPTQMTMTLAPDRMRPLFRSSFGARYRFVPRVGSTQDELRADDPEGTIVAADEQTAGRGRRGHRWLAPPGRALLMSVRLRPNPSRPVAQISLVAGVVVASLLERELDRTATIKWPNDVLIEAAKVAGILAEQRDGGVALGIGINVNQSCEELPDDSRITASSLRLLDGVVRDRAPLLARLAEQLERGYEAWQARGLAAIAGELATRDALRERQLRVGQIAGTGAGIAESGALLVRTAEGVREVHAGDVEVEW